VGATNIQVMSVYETINLLRFSFEVVRKLRKRDKARLMKQGMNMLIELA
jgi:hypothetical protein